MLACRRALFESTWEQIVNGCKNYKAYCQASGREGSDFVQAPQRFIEDGSFLEEFAYQVPADPKVTEHRAKEAERFDRARAAGLQIGLHPMQGECAAAFETRIRMQQDRLPSRPVRVEGIESGRPELSGQLTSRISSLAERMRIAK